MRVSDYFGFEDVSGAGPNQPFAWGVLYRRPNPDGTRKNCQNCMMFIAKDTDGQGKCGIHARSQAIKPTDVCGYHVFGKPMPAWMDHPGMQPVTPAESGLRNAGQGLVCANCTYFRGNSGPGGNCIAVANQKTGQPPQAVQALGWCARHESV